MQKNINIIKKATREWVSEFNAIPYSIVEKICKYDIDSMYELTDTEDEYTDFLPMWGTLWTFGDSIDEEWARDNIDIMQKCGFRVYEQEDLGILFGIDAAGYDFYENHFIPLYKLRTLRWHEENDRTA